MLVKVKRSRVPYVGRLGDVVEVADRHARVLILLGAVEEAGRQEPQPAPEGGTYGRRDMRAADSPRPRRRAPKR